MLDKSIKYKRIIMKLSTQGYIFSEPKLPEGYKFKFYEKGDAEAWARVETSVLEFDSETDALKYFDEKYTPHEDILSERCIFVINPDGLAVATATAWFFEHKQGRVGGLHWISVSPEYQGLGLGRAVTVKALQVLSEKEKGRDIFLGTQTWSHKAVRLYHSLGFNMIKSGRLISKYKYRIKNDYRGAVKVLKGVLDETTMRSLVCSAVR